MTQVSRRPTTDSSQTEGGTSDTVPHTQPDQAAATSQTDAHESAPAFAEGRRNPATRADLVELHSRMITMFKTLNQGLGEVAMKTAQRDRKELSDRLDRLEDSMNSIESALRVELTPEIESILKEKFERPVRRNGRGIQSMVVGVVAALALLFAGSVFSKEIQFLVGSGENAVISAYNKIAPIWGH